MAGMLFEEGEYTREEVRSWSRAEREYAETFWALGASDAPLFEEGEYTLEEMRGWSQAERDYARHEWDRQAGFRPGIDIQVSGVDELARSFETLSDRAHKELIPAVLANSVNRLNAAIVQNIPVGPRGREGDTGGWRAAQARMQPERIATRAPHSTTYAAPLPSEQDLGIRGDESFYPFNVEFGTVIHNAMAPIRRAVHRLEHSVWGELFDLMGHGLGGLAIPIGAGLLMRKILFGRATPKDLMPIDYAALSRTRGGVYP